MGRLYGTGIRLRTPVSQITPSRLAYSLSSSRFGPATHRGYALVMTTSSKEERGYHEAAHAVMLRFNVSFRQGCMK
jgi:hypothetical protein